MEDIALRTGPRFYIWLVCSPEGNRLPGHIDKCLHTETLGFHLWHGVLKSAPGFRFGSAMFGSGTFSCNLAPGGV